LKRALRAEIVLVTEQPDLTLDEIVAAMRKRQIPGSRTAVWRFFARHQLTVKKKSLHAAAGRGPRTPPLAARTAHV
jgi:transposase